MSYNNIPLSNFLPSSFIFSISKMSSKTMLDFDEAMDEAEDEAGTENSTMRYNSFYVTNSLIFCPLY